MGEKDFAALIMLPQKQFYTLQITADKRIDYTSNAAGIITYIHTDLLPHICDFLS